MTTNVSAPEFIAVGATALTNRTLRSLAAWLNWPPERLRLVVWVVSLVGGCLL